MNNYHMNRNCGRPYQTTCGMNRPQSRECMSARTVEQGNCSANHHQEKCHPKISPMPVDEMTPAMGYVPWQKFTDSFDLCYGLQVGTIFPELCRPFCGKRGWKK